MLSLWICATFFLCSFITVGAESDEGGKTSFVPDERYPVYATGKEFAPADSSVEIDPIANVTVSGQEAPETVTLDGKTGLVTGEEGLVTWQVTVPSDGMYNIEITYYPLEGKGATIERALYVDGEIPYLEAKSLFFNRIWVNQGEKIWTSSGNEFRRAQVEAPAWTTVPLRSSSGYTDEDLGVYLTKGEHTLTLESVAEPMAIAGIRLYVEKPLPTYEEIQKIYTENNYTPAAEGGVYEAEDAVRKSSSMLYAVEDRTSPATSPYDETRILLNCIGSGNWKHKGQWLEWEIDVPSTGLYTLSFRGKQDYISGASSTRRLLIDGEVPFQEAACIETAYSLNWQMITPGGDEPYAFYLTEGTHTLRLEVVTGRLSPVLYEINQTVQELNILYRQIIMITGNFPDRLRDYDLEGNIPDLRNNLSVAVSTLEEANRQIEALSGGKGEQSVYIDQLLVQLRSFLQDLDTLPERVNEMNDNINALASWVASAAEVPLLLDTICLIPYGGELPEAEAGFLVRLWSSIKSFFLSFVMDYYSIESFVDMGEGDKVTLWLAGTTGAATGTGRDQAMIIKNLSDYHFTKETGIALELRLVDMEVLLRAVASGSGPDVALFQSQAQPLNYGVRGALYDLNTFPDAQEVCGRFDDSAVLPFRMGEHLYGLPEQQVFPMMFCRTDVLGELGVVWPETWDDLYRLIPVLQEQNMEIGLPTPALVQSGSDATAINSVFSALLLQNGGTVYDEDSRLCTLNSLEAVDSFIEWSEFYTKYNFSKTYSEINRFRTGTMPILITSYTFYNTLALAAPEIQGLWTMVPIPGTVGEDGTIHREAASSISSCVMFKNADSPKACWEFLKWWTSKDIQVQYGREIEALQGPSARWPTANLEAMKELGWSASVSHSIQEQWRFVEGIAEVPGGYYVGRSIDNAIKSVINMGKNPRETLLNAVDDINEEILNKRQEFGLE